MEIGVYGLGRFGVFWASLLSKYYTVKVYSRTKKENLPPELIWVNEDEILAAPVIFFCVAISCLEQVLKKVVDFLKPGTLIMDTCSVKVYPALKMKELIPDNIEIIATHPMFGPDSAKQGLKGLPLVLCPVRVKNSTLNDWNKFFQTIGLKVFIMDPYEHDHEAAFTQGITHYMGRVLADLQLKESKLATLGYQKLLEIIEQTCNDPWQLFLDIQRYNPYTKEMRMKLHKSLERIFKKLEGSLDMLKQD